MIKKKPVHWYCYRQEVTTIPIAARMSGINYNTIRSRINRAGIVDGESIDDLIDNYQGLKGRSKVFFLFKGELMSFVDIASTLGCSHENVRLKICRSGLKPGDDVTKAMRNRTPGRKKYSSNKVETNVTITAAISKTNKEWWDKRKAEGYNSGLLLNRALVLLRRYGIQKKT